MKRGVLIICDREEAYARRLMEYLNRKERLFDICIFTGVEVLLDYIGTHRADILLIEEELMEKRISELVTGRIILLSEGSQVQEDSEFAMVYKLQPAEAIEREIMSCYATGGPGLCVETATDRRVQIWGVFSPAGGCGKTTFAMNLGSWLSRQKNVLYLNLESLGSLISDSDRGGMTDLLYYVKERKENLFLLLSSLAEKRQGLDCILPVDSYADLEALEEKDVDYLLEELEKSRYDVIILDIGFLNTRTFYLLSRCGRIFLPRFKEEENTGKMVALERNLRIEGREGLLLKMEQILVPRVQGPEMERFLWKLVQDE